MLVVGEALTKKQELRAELKTSFYVACSQISGVVFVHFLLYSFEEPLPTIYTSVTFCKR